jgi:putative transposase
MSRYRLYPTPAQEEVLLGHCAHARYVWNLAVEQRSWWQPGRPAPGFTEQCRQLTEARAASPWLAAGSVVIQQQALRDFHAAYASWLGSLREWRSRSTNRPSEERAAAPSPPSWRKRGRSEGFRIVAVDPADVRRLNRHRGVVLIPKLGWVRFRWSRPVPAARSYRVTRDRAGRWHVAFAAVPASIPAPGNGEVVGVDRGVNVSAALSTGELLTVAGLRPAERRRLRLLERRLARARPGSKRRCRVKLAVTRLKAREADRRRDWTEKVSTDLARRFDLICVEDLDVRAMTRTAKGTLERPGRGVRQKAGLNRSILASGWGRLVDRLEDKAPGRVQEVTAAFTSQTCSACGHIAWKSRESQPSFRCVTCGHEAHADINAARNIAAAGQVVAARGGQGWPRPVNREPSTLGAVALGVETPVLPGQGGCQSRLPMTLPLG